MAKKSMIIKQQRKQKFSTREYTDARSAEDLMLIFVSTEFAVSASENLLTRVKSPA